MHGPYHRFSAADDLPDGLQRKHALVDPVQMYDVSLLELRQGSDVVSRIGDIECKEILPGKMKAAEDAPALPQEIPLHPERAWQPYYGNIIGHLIAHQHLSLNTIVVKGIHQAIGSYSSTTRLLTCIYYEYSHDYPFYSACKDNVKI